MNNRWKSGSSGSSSRPFAVFDAELDAQVFRLGQELLQQFVGAFDVFLLAGFALFERLPRRVFRIWAFPFLPRFQHVEQFAGVILHLDAAIMQHHHGRLEARRQFHGLARVTQGVLAFRAGFPRKAGKGSARNDSRRWAAGKNCAGWKSLISPASTASMMPGSRLMRVPWLNSAYSKPRSRISRNMARPSVCRWEFQQVESEYIKQRPNAVINSTASGHGEFKGLQIRVTGGQHGGEPGRFHLATAPFARLFKMPVVAHDLQRAFAVDFLFQSPQGLFDWLAFF